MLYHCLIVYTFPTLRANKSTVWSTDKSINPVPQQAQLSNKSTFALLWFESLFPLLALQQLPLLFGHGWDPQTSWLPMTTRAPAFFQSLCSLFTRPSVMWYNQFVWSQAHLPSAYYLFKQLLWLGLWKICDVTYLCLSHQSEKAVECILVWRRRLGSLCYALYRHLHLRM